MAGERGATSLPATVHILVPSSSSFTVSLSLLLLVSLSLPPISAPHPRPRPTQLTLSRAGRWMRALVLRGGSDGAEDAAREDCGERRVVYTRSKKRRLCAQDPEAPGDAFDWSSDG
eukprot:767807-Hanusia_phi.AAC.3